jgi:hypothetical protein
MVKGRVREVFTGVLLLASAACHAGDGCKLQADVGVLITLRDARTGTNPTTIAVATISSGTYVERDTSYIAPSGQQVITGLLEKEGVFDILIRASGYKDWVQNGVGVPSDGCHVQVQLIDATLTPV